jgi:hypothetical protein
MICFKYIIVNTMYKSDNIYNNNNIGSNSAMQILSSCNESTMPWSSLVIRRAWQELSVQGFCTSQNCTLDSPVKWDFPNRISPCASSGASLHYLREWEKLPNTTRKEKLTCTGTRECGIEVNSFFDCPFPSADSLVLALYTVVGLLNKERNGRTDTVNDMN